MAAIAAVVSPATAAPQRLAPTHSYVVLYENGTSLASARLAVRAAGGFLVAENRRVGVATATSSSPTFAADLLRQGSVAGVARNKPVGYNAPAMRQRRSGEDLSPAERASVRAKKPGGAPAPAADPLGSLQWDMAMIHATPSGSYAVEPGDRDVLVGVLDTGIDGSHPDIAPNFNAALSRNFTVDIPLIDGPCASDPDGSCNDPANVDEDGHGTHVAGTIASPLNGIGMAGVAPNVTLVNLRAGQDSGYFFLQPSVDALTFAGDHGIDVVNMSYFIDPWLYNCSGNPADSATQQLEQRTIIAATTRALEYARRNGVTLIAAAGNEHTDMDHPTVDEISPDYPPGSEYTRNVDNSCLTMPTEGPNVVSVGAVGPSTIKADYSNWGQEGVDVTAPGGYFRDLFGTPAYRTVATQILGPYPRTVAEANGDLNPDGTPNTEFVVRDCHGTTCAYYQYIQGTSMASPHAVGVAALIVSRYGHPDPQQGGIALNPVQTEKILMRTAAPHACPIPPVLDYTNVGRPPSYTATCIPEANFGAGPGVASPNSIWGTGIVDALRAVTDRNG
jgi:subtilisin family serine protease